MTDTDATLRELLAKVPALPWDLPYDGLSDARHIFARGIGGERYVLANCKASMTFGTASTREIDRDVAALIVAAVNALPALLDRLATAERERGRMVEALEQITEMQCAECGYIKINNVARAALQPESRP